MQRPFTDLESQPFFRRTVWRRTLWLAVALLVNLLVVAFVAALHVDVPRENVKPHDNSVYVLGYNVHFAFDRPHTYFWLAALLVAQVVLAHWAFRQMLAAEGMISLYPEDKTKGRTFGGLSGQQLVKMVQELAAQMSVGPIKRIVVSDRPDPNAYTAHVLGLGHIVVLHANLLEILPPAGVRAIVAHEVAHARRGDSLTYMAIGFPRSFIVLMGAFILWKIGVGIVWFEDPWELLQRLLFLALVWSLATFVLARLGRLANLASQQSEHIADAYAAAACGVEPALNALLLVGERAEALTVLQQTLAKQPHLLEGMDEDELIRVLRRFPPRELSKDRAKWLARRIYVEAKLAHLRDALCVPLSEEQIVELAKQADAALKQRQEKESTLSDTERRKLEKAEDRKEAEEEKLLIDWRKYDFDRSGHLDLAETAVLVEELRNNPQKMIFRQFLGAQTQWQSHPTMRDRVLFLYDGFRPAGVSQKSI